MAHELTIENGKASMMYYGETPWHSLGTRLQKPATSEEAIIQAGLDWDVVKKPVYLKLDKRFQVKDTFAMVRKDKWQNNDCDVLGVVGKNYTPVQNKDAFNFFDSIVGDKKAIYHTAGSLSGGKIIWILAKLPGYIRVINNDISEKYLLLSNSHDGSSMVQIKFTPIRVVCMNTLTVAMNKGETLKIKHCKDVKDKMRQASELLGIVNEKYDVIERSFKNMVKVQLNEKKLNEYIKSVFPDPVDELQYATVDNNREMVRDLFENGLGNNLPGVKGTLWAGYNAITELVDHKITKQNKDMRTKSIWFGNGYNVKQKAFDVANEKMKLWLN